MLKLKKVCKYYQIGKNKKQVLDNITLDFKDRELVFILGASGSGKSTLLNIIGGNLRCDSGEIWLDGDCISNYSDKELDKYRSLVIGNIFQDYNLIDYMSVVENVMLGYVGGMEKKEIARLFKQLGIYDKRYEKVVNLSGGEKQRVAIARALVNNPDIIIADEPTGALDSKTGMQVMDILKNIAFNKLVIVVSHDNYLANKYASRIINLKDGKCNYEIIPGNSLIVKNERSNKSKLRMVIKFAIKSLWLKKIRTLFTAIAISLGVISMALVTNLANSFSKEIDDLEKESVAIFPITISNGDYQITDAQTEKASDKLIIKDRNKFIHTNKINSNYLTFLKSIKEIDYIAYNYDMSMPLISDTYNQIDNKYLRIIPSNSFIDDNYHILEGKNINDKYQVLLRVDENNNVDSELLNAFNINTNITYKQVIGRRIKVALNDIYYIKNGDYYIINNDLHKLYDESKIELTIVGVVKPKKENEMANYLYISEELIEEVIKLNSESEIVKDARKGNNVLGDNHINTLSYLGYNTLPNLVSIYISDIDKKNKVIGYLDEYNANNDKLIYTDTMRLAIDIIKKFIMIISIILIIFSIVAIIISSLMVGILTNVRILERKKEIGIFRSLGASVGDIRRLFNIQNIFIGMVAMIISLIVINFIKIPINKMVENYLEIENIFRINYGLLFLVFIINLLIILIAGIIPTVKASKAQIVDCIYNR